MKTIRQQAFFRQRVLKEVAKGKPVKRRKSSIESVARASIGGKCDMMGRLNHCMQEATGRIVIQSSIHLRNYR